MRPASALLSALLSVPLSGLSLSCSGERVEQAHLVVPSGSAAPVGVAPSISLQVVGASGPAIAHAALSADGALLATSAGVEITVWEVDTGARRASIRAATSPSSLSFSADSAELRTLEGRYRVADGARLGEPARLAEPPARDELAWASLRPAELRALEGWARRNGGAVQRDGKRAILTPTGADELWASVEGLLVAGERGALRLDLQKSWTFPSPRLSPRASHEPRFGPDPERMVLLSLKDRSLADATLWDTRAGVSLGALGAWCLPFDVTWSAKGRWLVRRDCDERRARAYDARTGSALGTFEGSEVIGISDDERRVAATFGPGSAAVYELPSLERVLLPPGSGDEPVALLFAPDGRTLLDLRAGELHAWTVPAGALAARVPLDAGRSPGLAYSRDGSTIVVGGVDVLTLLDAKTLRVRARHAASGPSAVSRDGSAVLLARVGELELLRGAGAAPMRVKHGKSNADVAALDVALSPDAALAAVAFEQGAVELYDLVNVRLLAVLEAPQQDASSFGLAFDATGSRLAYTRQDAGDPLLITWEVGARVRSERGPGATKLLFTDGGVLIALDGQRVSFEEPGATKVRSLALPDWAAPAPAQAHLAHLAGAPAPGRWFPEGPLDAAAHLGTMSPDGSVIAWAQNRAVVVRRRATDARPASLFAYRLGRDDVTLALLGAPRPSALFVGGACGWDGPAGAERFVRALPAEPGAPAPDVAACKRPGLVAQALADPQR